MIEKIKVYDSSSRALRLLIEGHNRGDWKLKQAHNGYPSIVVLGEISNKEYIINSNLVVYLDGHAFCTSPSPWCEKEYTETILLYTLYIKYQEKYFLNNATYKCPRIPFWMTWVKDPMHTLIPLLTAFGTIIAMAYIIYAQHWL